MSQLRLHLFGSVRVSPPGGEADARLGRSARSLLAFLLLNRRRLHSREALSGLFWGDASQERAVTFGREALRRAVELVARAAGLDAAGLSDRRFSIPDRFDFESVSSW